MAGDFFVGSGPSGVPALALPRRVKGYSSMRQAVRTVDASLLLRCGPADPSL
jgi:hypothetical protein